MALKMKVTYLDGKVEEALVSPKAQVLTERQYGGIGEERQVESGYYMAWQALRLAGKESSDFENWLELIEDIDQVASEPTPTQLAQPTSTSSD